VPYHTTWAHEEVKKDPISNQFFRINHLREILDLLI